MAEDQTPKQEIKKEEPKKENLAEKQTPAPQKEEKPKQEEAKAQAEKPAQEQKTAPKPANCMKCNRHLQRKTWYYRDNGYYCSKRCWKLAMAAKKKKPNTP